MKLFGAATAFVAWVAMQGSPAIAEETIAKNGSPVLGEQDSSLPRQTVVVAFGGGPGLVAPEKQGLTAIAGRMLSNGSVTLNGDEYRRRLFLLNAAVAWRSGYQRFEAQITAPPDRLRDALSLVRSALTRPILEQSAFDDAKGALLSMVESRDSDMQQAIFYFGTRDAFQHHPRILDGAGSRVSLSRITLEDVRWHVRILTDLRHALFATVGPMDLASVRKRIDDVFFAQESSESHYAPVAAEPVRFPNSAEPEITVLHKAGATDNQILFIFPKALRMDTPDKAIADVAQALLGGGVDGRLGAELRVKRGLTYGASTIVSPVAPAWMMWTFGGVAQTGDLLRQIPRILETFKKDEPSRSDLRRAIARCVTEYKSKTELPSDLISQQMQLRLQGWDIRYVDRHLSALERVTAADVKRYARSLELNQGRLYVMGDRANLEPTLKALYPKRPIRVVPLSEMP